MSTTKKIKVLRIITRLNVGGPAKQALWLTAALNDNEYESVLVSGIVPEGEDDITKSFSTGARVTYLPSLKRAISPVADITATLKLYSIIKRFKPDIIHTHTSKAGFVGRAAAYIYNLLRSKGKRLKVVHTFHGHTFYGYFSPGKAKLFLAIERTLAKHATDRIIAISNKLQKELTEVYKVGGKDQYAMIPLGIDLKPFENRAAYKGGIRGRFSIPPEKIIIAAIGRIAPIKHYEMFLRVAKVILLDTGIDAHFLLVGGGSQAAEGKLKSLARDLGISASFTLAGNMSDIEKVFADIDILALTSKNEGTPVSIIEAFASKVPVCATDVGGVRDLVGDGEQKRGLLAPSEDIPEFARQLRRLIEDKALRERLVSAGHKHVASNLSLERLTGDIKWLYSSMNK